MQIDYGETFSKHHQCIAYYKAISSQLFGSLSIQTEYVVPSHMLFFHRHIASSNAESIVYLESHVECVYLCREGVFQDWLCSQFSKGRVYQIS